MWCSEELGATPPRALSLWPTPLTGWEARRGPSKQNGLGHRQDETPMRWRLDERRRHSAQREGPDTRGHGLCDFIHVKGPEQANS